LDEYEELFKRRRVLVHLGDRTLTAWAYFLAHLPKAAAVIQEGDWRAHLRSLRRHLGRR